MNANVPTNLVSIIIPAYNAESFIEATLSSVEKQTHTDFECLIIDDGSTDLTGEVAKSWAQKDPRFKLLSKTGEGLPGKARNFGIVQAQGDYLAFLDADDLWHPKKLETQLNLMLSHPHINWSVTERISFQDERLALSFLQKQPGNHVYRASNIYRQLLQKNTVTLSTVMIKKSFVTQLNLFSEAEDLKVCEDYFLWLKAAKSNNVLIIQEELTAYRLHDQNISRNKVRLAHSLHALARHLGKNLHDPLVYRAIRAQALKTEAATVLKLRPIRALILLLRSCGNYFIAWYRYIYRYMGTIKSP